jgi:hypothetical protein
MYSGTVNMMMMMEFIDTVVVGGPLHSNFNPWEYSS